MYLIWFLICSTTAKHLPMQESSDESQRPQPVSSLTSSILQPSDPSYSESNTISPVQEKTEEENTISFPLAFDSGGKEAWNSHKSDINGTQSNDTSADDSSEKEAVSEDVAVESFGTSEPASSSTVMSVDSNFIQKISMDGHKEMKSEESRSLKRVFLSNRSIVCNDGSQAGFYLRKSQTGSQVWVVFLEGGWYCYDRQSCRNRWLRLRHLMTSSQWADTRDVNGILSSNPTENPYWHSANHVTIPYCSSDTWSGTAPLTPGRDNFHFMGKLIVNQVIKDLVPLGLQNSSQLILAGSSAGGTGVMVNLDPIQHLLHAELGLKHIAVRGISDSGWFLDRTPYSPSTLPAVDAIKKGHALWQGSLPKRCVDLYKQEPWRCYFGYRLYPTIRAPLFVFQWLFDEAQMTADNVGAPVTPQQWDYIHSMGRALRDSFANVSAVFAPSCVSHSVLTKKDWTKVKIDDVSVAQALRCWELATMKRPPRNQPFGRGSPNSRPARKLVKSGIQISEDEERRINRNQNRRRRRRKHQHSENENSHQSRFNKNPRVQQQNKNQRSKNNQHKNSNQRRISNLSNSNRNTNQYDRIKHRSDNKKKGNLQNCSGEGAYKKRVRPVNRKNQLRCETFGNGRRHNRNRGRLGNKRLAQNNITKISIIEERLLGQGDTISSDDRPVRPQRSLMRGYRSGGCEHRHIERCSWPQCSHSCPRLLDPYTGEEVHFIDMLKSFGLRMDSVASALGVDIHTLNNMEHAELLNLLTQQIN